MRNLGDPWPALSDLEPERIRTLLIPVTVLVDRIRFPPMRWWDMPLRAILRQLRRLPVLHEKRRIGTMQSV